MGNMGGGESSIGIALEKGHDGSNGTPMNELNPLALLTLMSDL